MKYMIQYSKAAIRDLERVRLEVLNASTSNDVTDKYINDLLDAVEAKADFPKSGKPLYYENTFTGYYFVIFKAYLAFYRVEQTSVLVDRVLFSGSDYMKILRLDNQ